MEKTEVTAPSDVDVAKEMAFFGKKKKKPKKMVPAVDTEKESSSVKKDESKPAVTMENIEEELKFEGKKKRKPKLRPTVDQLISEDKENADELSDVADNDTSKATDNAADGYDYNFMLGRIYEDMKINYPHLLPEKRKKLNLPPPLVYLDGTRKTAFVNFLDICNKLHRKPKHVLDFFLSEFATSGSFDSSNKLIIKGRFREREVHTVITSYIKEYVSCTQCRSADTYMTKQFRMFFLICETCGSRRVVSQISAGYRAVTSSRSRQR